MSMSLTMSKQHEQAVVSPPVLDEEWVTAFAKADDLADRIAGDPEALAEFRRLICEGLEGEIVACDDDEAWLASLADDIRSRAAARR